MRARIELPNHSLDAILRPQRERPDAKVTSVLAVAVDCTEEERAAEERRWLHDWLAREHKQGSVGLLATSLAHAFSNLLAGMLANASSARQTLAADHPSAGALDDVIAAATRAAALARQLLQTAVPAPGESRPLEILQPPPDQESAARAAGSPL